jgi:hypothetical protein
MRWLEEARDDVTFAFRQLKSRCGRTSGEERSARATLSEPF